MKRVVSALVLTLAIPTTTAAAQSPPPAPTPTPTPTPAPPPAPVAGTLTSSALDVLAGARPTALTGRAFTARVVLRPFVAGEKVTVRVYRGSRKLQVRALTPTPVAGNTAGVALVKVESARPGTLAIKVSHRATPSLATVVARTLRVAVLRPHAAPGERGTLVRLLQAKLAGLRYSVPRTGVFDAGTANAVMAWRKVAGLARTNIASEEVFAGLLRGRGTFKVRHPQDGHHVEARLDKQVLALIDRGKVVRIYHMSSGKASTPTVRGRFHVYMKSPGTNAKGMFDSNYFIRGYAIHGYPDVPPFNASHGCLRVPNMNAPAIYDWVRIGDVVWVE
jgi:peptidoglycan hydrolase-like protein with peptidoglycan-binding domain